MNSATTHVPSASPEPRTLDTFKGEVHALLVQTYRYPQTDAHRAVREWSSLIRNAWAGSKAPCWASDHIHKYESTGRACPCPKHARDAEGFSKKKLWKDIGREQRKEARAKIAGLKSAVRTARARKRGVIGAAKATCRSEKAFARKHVGTLRSELKQATKVERAAAHAARERLKLLRAELEAAAVVQRAAARSECDARLVEAKAIQDEAARAAAELEAERQYQAEMRQIEKSVRARKAEAKHASRAEKQSESDDAVRANIPAELVPLFERVKRSIKPGLRKSRTEAFLEYVEEHPSEELASIEDKTEAMIRAHARGRDAVRLTKAQAKSLLALVSGYGPLSYRERDLAKRFIVMDLLEAQSPKDPAYIRLTTAGETALHAAGYPDVSRDTGRDQSSDRAAWAIVKYDSKGNERVLEYIGTRGTTGSKVHAIRAAEVWTRTYGLTPQSPGAVAVLDLGIDPTFSRTVWTSREHDPIAVLAPIVRRRDQSRKIEATSKDRYRASAAERRQYGGNTVTEFYVHFAEDRNNPSKWITVRGYGPTPGDRKTDAIRRAMPRIESIARDPDHEHERQECLVLLEKSRSSRPPSSAGLDEAVRKLRRHGEDIASVALVRKINEELGIQLYGRDPSKVTRSFAAAARKLEAMIVKHEHGEDNHAAVMRAVERLDDRANKPEIRGDEKVRETAWAEISRLRARAIAAEDLSRSVRRKYREAEIEKLKESRPRPGTYEHELAVGRIKRDYAKFVGKKYKSGMDLAEIAKLIRADIKDAVRTKQLPHAKYGVKISRYSMGQSLNVTISDVKIPGAKVLHLWNEKRLLWEKDKPHDFTNLERYSASAEKFLKDVEDIVNAYKRSETEGQTDYHNTNFFGDVKFDYDWEAKVKKQQLAHLDGAAARDPGEAWHDPGRARYAVSYSWAGVAGGRGKWFKSKAEALRIAESWHKRGMKGVRVLDDKGHAVWEESHPGAPEAALVAAAVRRTARKTSPAARDPRRFKTQAEINKAIGEYEARGIRAEERRDRAPFESAQYWKHHDIAMKWFAKAEALMPGGSGSVVKMYHLDDDLPPILARDPTGVPEKLTKRQLEDLSFLASFGTEGVLEYLVEPPVFEDLRKLGLAAKYGMIGRTKSWAVTPLGTSILSKTSRDPTGVPGFAAKREARLDRMRARAERLERLAESSRAREAQIASYIPMGQPILVGHHSEKRHRKDIERMNALMRKSIEARKEAESLKSRIASSGKAISSDDPEAVVLLKEKLAEAERQHASLLEVNKRLKKGATPEDVAPLLDWWKDPPHRLLIWFSMGHKTIPLGNSSAEIRRIKARIEELTKKAAAPAKAPETIGDVRIEESENRVRLYFPGKPPDTVRAALKSAGFRWSPTSGAWQRMASTQAWYHARQIASRDPGTFEKMTGIRPEPGGRVSMSDGTAVLYALDPAGKHKKKKVGKRKKISRDMETQRAPFRRCPVGTEVQSVVLEKSKFTPHAMKAWLEKAGFHMAKVDETENTVRFRQQDPKLFLPQSFRIITLSSVARAVIGCPKRKS